MDNHKKLFEGLLKADGIDPAGPTESERIAFGIMLDEQSKLKQSEPDRRLDLWRIIMRSQMAKLATAAVVLLAIALTITLMNKTATPAWAIDQTIEALDEMSVVHISGYAKYPDKPKHVFQIWAMPHSGNRSVSGNFRLEEGDDHIAVANEKENLTSVYTRNAKGDVVYITEGLNRGCTPFPMSDLFRQFKEIGKDWKEEYALDKETGRNCVFVTLVGPAVNTARYWKLQFDVESKLPIRAGVWWNENYEGEPHFDYTTIEYSRKLPAEYFDFVIPEGTQVVDCRKLRALLGEDSEQRVSVGQLNTSDACKKVVEEYWRAVIGRNWEDVERIRPSVDDNSLEQLRAVYREHEPLELLNIAGMNHLDDPGTFAEVSCVVRMKDGSIWHSILNVEINRTRHGRIGVIAGSIQGELTEAPQPVTRP